MFSGLCDPIYGRERGWVQDAGWFPSMCQKNPTVKSLITCTCSGRARNYGPYQSYYGPEFYNKEFAIITDESEVNITPTHKRLAPRP